MDLLGYTESGFQNIFQYLVFALDMIWCTTVWIINIRCFIKHRRKDPEAVPSLARGVVWVFNIMLLRQMVQIDFVGDTRWFNWVLLVVILIARWRYIAKVKKSKYRRAFEKGVGYI